VSMIRGLKPKIGGAGLCRAAVCVALTPPARTASMPSVMERMLARKKEKKEQLRRFACAERCTEVGEGVLTSGSSKSPVVLATDLVVGGCSAGATAAFLHLDWWAAQAPTAAKVRGMPDSGWFLDGQYNRDRKDDYAARMRHLFTMVNASASLSTACVAAKGYLCLFAPHLVPYTRTPLLALNSRFDASMGRGRYNRDGAPPANYNCTPYTAGPPCDPATVDAFGRYVARSMRRLLQPPHGGYLDACYRHCSTNDANYNIHMEGTDAAHAAADWYARGSAALPNRGFWEQQAAFPCESCCA